MENSPNQFEIPPSPPVQVIDNRTQNNTIPEEGVKPPITENEIDKLPKKPKFTGKIVFFSIFLILAVVIASAGVFLYHYYFKTAVNEAEIDGENTTTPLSEDLTSSPNEKITQEPKKHSNYVYGFEFYFPGDHLADGCATCRDLEASNYVNINPINEKGNGSFSVKQLRKKYFDQSLNDYLDEMSQINSSQSAVETASIKRYSEGNLEYLIFIRKYTNDQRTLFGYITDGLRGIEIGFSNYLPEDKFIPLEELSNYSKFDEIVKSITFVDDSELTYNWILYRNKKFFYQVEVPSDADFEEDANGNLTISLPKESSLYEIGSGYVVKIDYAHPALENNLKSTTSDYTDETEDICKFAEFSKPILGKINSRESYKIDVADCLGSDGSYYAVQKDTDIFSIYQFYAGDTEKKALYKKTTETILGTFGFI